METIYLLVRGTKYDPELDTIVRDDYVVEGLYPSLKLAMQAAELRTEGWYRLPREREWIAGETGVWIAIHEGEVPAFLKSTLFLN